MRVRGEGPKSADVMLVGEAPGRFEDQTGRPFVGPSGQELTRFLQRAGMRRGECYITNVVKERPPGNRDPLPEEIARDASELATELKRVRPRVIGALGRFAAHWALGRDFTDMETDHGIVRWARFPGILESPVMVVPIYHPAAALHQPSLLGHVAWDIEQLAMTVRGDLTPYEPPRVNPVYLESYDGSPILPDWRLPYIAIDTEGTPEDPWGLSWSQGPRTGYVVRRTKERAMRSFREELGRFLMNGGKVLLHNAPWDLLVLRALGIRIVPASAILDTMVAAYLLRLEPQGLKNLARRHLHMQMSSYEETTYPASQEIARSYFEEILAQQCPACEGTGEGLIELKTKMKVDRCQECRGDGTSWPTPEPVLEWDALDNFSIRQPQRIATWVRARLAAGENLHKSWAKYDEASKQIVAARLGKVMPEVAMDDLPLRDAIHYAARDADATFQVWSALQPRIEAEGLGEALQLDCAILPMVAEMMRVGMGVEREDLMQLSEDLQTEMARTRGELEHLVGEPINPGSGDQVAELLYRTMKLPPVGKPTKGGRPSTNNKTIEGLRVACAKDDTVAPVLDMILAYRQAAKLDGTYARPLREKARWSEELQTWRVHTRIKTTRTDTGRLSSADPNLQNIPARSVAGQRVRHAFTAGPGMLLGAWDYDQIEMRVLAIESGDENLRRVFLEGIDIHAMTASLCFEIPIDKVEKWQRRAAKTVGFGVVYGMSEKGLLDQLATMGIIWSEAQCRDLIRLYLEKAYPGVGAYMKSRYAEAAETGAVRDMFGRVRMLSGVGSRDRMVHAEALRQAGNMPIQSAAAGVLKLAMERVWNDALPSLRMRTGIRIYPLMQIHDELVFEFDEDAGELVNLYMKDAMESEMKGITFSVSGKWGKRWSDCKD